jgi:hypothetical protein
MKKTLLLLTVCASLIYPISFAVAADANEPKTSEQGAEITPPSGESKTSDKEAGTTPPVGEPGPETPKDGGHVDEQAPKDAQAQQDDASKESAQPQA